MTAIAKQDIPCSVRCVGLTNVTVLAGLSTHFLNATHLLFGCWVKSTSHPDGVNFRECLLFRGDSGTNAFAAFTIANNFNEIYVTGLGGASSRYPIAKDSWFHAIGEIDIPANVIRLWVNGVLVVSTPVTFTRDLASVTSISTYIGDNGAPGFEGQIANAFIQRRTAPATQVEIDNLYAKGQFPTCEIGFFWPLDDGNGTTALCYSTVNDGNVIQRGFNGVLNSSTMWGRNTPMPANIADRVGGNCISTSGLAGYYRNNSDLIHNTLFGKRYVALSVWAMMTGYIPGIDRHTVIIRSGAGTAGVLIQINTTGAIVFGARSVSADAFNSAIPPSSGICGSMPLNTWVKLDLLVDYTAKIVEGFVNGICVARNAAATFAQDTFQMVRGIDETTLGSGIQFWPGKLDDIGIFYGNDMPTKAEMRAWYLQNQLPKSLVLVCQLDCEDFGPDLIDKSGNGLVFNPIAISAPFGLNPQSYMP